MSDAVFDHDAALAETGEPIAVRKLAAGDGAARDPAPVERAAGTTDAARQRPRLKDTLKVGARLSAIARARLAQMGREIVLVGHGASWENLES